MLRLHTIVVRVGDSSTTATRLKANTKVRHNREQTSSARQQGAAVFNIKACGECSPKGQKNMHLSRSETQNISIIPTVE